MREKITIAVDAMGGDNSPKKVIEGIKISLIKNPNLKFLLFGDEKILVNYLGNEKNILQNIEIHHCSQKVEDDESPLSGAKKGNSTSMWQCIEAQKKIRCRHIVICWKHWRIISDIKNDFGHN